MSPAAISPTDPRLTTHHLSISPDITYHYRIATSTNTSPIGTILLLHGWPDLWYGFRFQVPFLLSLNYCLIIPDMLGYGNTSAPAEPEEYSLKRMAEHMAKLIAHVATEHADTAEERKGGTVEEGGKKVIVMAHDWGAYLAYRLAMYHPQYIRALICFCIPFTPPLPPSCIPDLEHFVEDNPMFTYQLQNASGEVEKTVGDDKDKLRGWLRSMFGGVTTEGVAGFDPYVGIVKEGLEGVGGSPLLNEQIMGYYVEWFSRTGLRGPMNWYRTRAINASDEFPLVEEYKGFQFQVPAMLVMAGQDSALTPDLADGQEKYFAKGIKKAVLGEASHWILVHCPEECNELVGDFLEALGEKEGV